MAVANLQEREPARFGRGSFTHYACMFVAETGEPRFASIDASFPPASSKRAGDPRRFNSRERFGHAVRRPGLFLGNCSSAPDGRSYNQDHIRTGLRLRSHIVDRHRSVFRSSLFLAG